MPAANVYRNVDNVKFGIAGTPLTSVKSVAVNPTENQFQDGTDNDLDYTINLPGLRRCNVVVTFRDINQADLLANQTDDDFYFRIIAPIGANSNRKVSNCSFGQVQKGGADWDNVELFTVSGVGGAHTPASGS
jgi:hypothetical protein